jgi:uncharacterized protein with FMN-binding domain
MADTAEQPRSSRPPVARRKHPSHGARVVALVGSVVATVGAGAGMAYADHSSSTTTAATAIGRAASSSAATSSSGTSSTPTAAGTTATYANGVYTGASEYTRWGNVQVQVTIKNGKIVSVQEVQAPSDGRSAGINSRAQPILQAEAISAQGSDIDAVSGATYTSQTYAASLQAALDQAAQPAATTG